MLSHNGWTPEKLNAFNRDIINIYEKGLIKAPIHLHGGNEEALINIFKANNITEKDWIASTYRSHFHWLLSGRDPEKLKQQILDGYSMHIFGNKFITSAIVSGIAPIALGIAEALVMKESKEKVYCFLGDMAACGGLVKECVQYAEGFDLPILYITEDNHMSVRAITQATWGSGGEKNKIMKYEYKCKFPHSGTGKYVMF